MRDRFTERMQYGDMISKCITEGKTIPWFFVHVYNEACYDCKAIINAETGENDNGNQNV